MNIRKLVFPVGLTIALFVLAQTRSFHTQRAIAATQPSAATTNPSSATPAASDRTPHLPIKPGEVRELAIKELGNFDYDENHGEIPADVRQLSGSVIRLRGFMIPMEQSDKITRFALVPNLFGCCFGQPPSTQHTIIVNCEQGRAEDYRTDEIIVEGKLSVGEIKDSGYVIGIFQLTSRKVENVAH